MRAARLLSLLLALTVAVGCATLTPREHQSDRRPDKSRLVLMTLNANFLWDGKAPEDGQIDFPHRNSPARALEHMAQISELIRKANADVVNLCEVEDERALFLLNDRYLKNMGYRPYFVQGRDTHTGQDMGLLTRLDPVGRRITRDERKGISGLVSKGVSKHYIATFESGGSRIAVIGIHLLAQPRNRARRAEREAQADAVRGMAVDLAKKGYHIIIVGDMNDFDGAPDSLDRRDSKPISRVLAILREMNPKNSADDLSNAAAKLPKEKRYTCFYDRNKDGFLDPAEDLDSIDHFLLSRFLFESIEKVEVLDDHDPRNVTNHFPLVVTLRWPPRSTQN